MADRDADARRSCRTRRAERVLMLACDGRGGDAAHARDAARRGSGAARGRSSGTRARPPGTRWRWRRSETTATAMRSCSRAPGRPRVSHRCGVVLRAVALARRRRARGERPEGSYVVSLLDARRRRGGAQGRRGGGRGGARRRSPSRTSGWSRSSPTSGSTATCCSPRAACEPARSRTSCAGGTRLSSRRAASHEYRRRMQSRRHRPRRAASGAERLARRWPTDARGPRRLRQSYVQYLTASRSWHGAAGRVRRARQARRSRSSRSSRSRACARRRLRPRRSYVEYPGASKPMRVLARLLDELGSGTIAADQDGNRGSWVRGRRRCTR